MASDNLLIKLSDEYIKYLQSPIWAIQKTRWIEYQDRLRGHISNFIRNNDFYGATALQGKVDNVDDLIKLTERLDKEILDKTFDVDVALHVIENKEGK